MKILILGAGQVGRTAADHLSREEANEVTVVDLNEEVLRDLQDRLDVRTVAGNAAHPTVLESAGAAEADIIVALTSSDEVNMMACEVAFTLFRTPTKIARIRAADYTSRAALFGAEGLSVDVFINPEQLVTEYVERLIYHPGTLQVLDFADGKVRLVGVRAQRDGLLVGQSLRELARHLPKVEVRVVAIYRDGRGVAPEGDTLVQEGDEIFFLAARHDIRRVMSELRHADDPARRIVIAGGGNIGLRLATTLDPHNQVKIIERDARRARRIAELLENTRSEEHTSELQSRLHLVCRLLLEKKNNINMAITLLGWGAWQLDKSALKWKPNTASPTVESARPTKPLVARTPAGPVASVTSWRPD